MKEQRSDYFLLYSVQLPGTMSLSSLRDETHSAVPMDQLKAMVRRVQRAGNERPRAHRQTENTGVLGCGYCTAVMEGGERAST